MGPRGEQCTECYYWDEIDYLGDEAGGSVGEPFDPAEDLEASERKGKCRADTPKVIPDSGSIEGEQPLLPGSEWCGGFIRRDDSLRLTPGSCNGCLQAEAVMRSVDTLVTELQDTRWIDFHLSAAGIDGPKRRAVLDGASERLARAASNVRSQWAELHLKIGDTNPPRGPKI